LNHRFLLVPAAIVMAAAPAAQADQLQSLEEAQQRLFPAAKLTPFELRLTPEQFAELKAEYQVPAHCARCFAAGVSAVAAGSISIRSMGSMIS